MGNDDFVKIIELVGWKEIITKENYNHRKRGKRYFKKTLNSKGEIYLDRDKINFTYGNYFCFISVFEIDEIDFICFINYCNNNSLRQKLKRKNFDLRQNCFKELFDSCKKEIELYSKYEAGKNYAKNLQKLVLDLTCPIQKKCKPIPDLHFF